MFNQKIIRICESKLIFLNYSDNTSKIYLHYISKFIQNLNKQIIHVNSADFQLYIDSYKFTSISQQNQYIKN